MNTSGKIVELEELEQLLSDGTWIAAVGSFDPMTASQADRLCALTGSGCKLVVVVIDNPEKLLPASARARLVAALRCVSAVCISTREHWRSALGGVPLDEDEAAENRRSADFVRLVSEHH